MHPLSFNLLSSSCYPATSSSSSSEEDHFVHHPVFGTIVNQEQQQQQIRANLMTKILPVQPDACKSSKLSIDQANSYLFNKTSSPSSKCWTFPPAKMRFNSRHRQSLDIRRKSSITDSDDDLKYPQIMLSISLLNQKVFKKTNKNDDEVDCANADDDDDDDDGINYNQIRGKNCGNLVADYSSTDDTIGRATIVNSLNCFNTNNSESNNIKVKLIKCDNLKRFADGERKLSESISVNSNNLPDKVFARIYRFNDLQKSNQLSRNQGKNTNCLSELLSLTLDYKQQQQICIKETSHVNSRKSRTIKFDGNDFVCLKDTDFPLYIALFETIKGQSEICLGHILVNFQPLFISFGQTAILSLRLYSSLIDAIVNTNSDDGLSSCRSSRSSSEAN